MWQCVLPTSFLLATHCLNEKRWTVCLMLLAVLSWLSQPPSQHTRLITLKAGGCHGDDLIVTGGAASCWSAGSGDTKVILAPFVFSVTYTYWYCLQHKYTAVPSWCSKRSPIFPWMISHGSPARASYGVSFMEPVSDWCSVSFPAMMYEMPCYIGPRYDGTRLYIYMIR